MGYDPFVGEITIWPANFAPYGYAFCDGQLLSISQNAALFSLIGNYFGGNGTTTFALPDLRGRVPVGTGQGPGLDFLPHGSIGGMANTTFNVQALTPAEEGNPVQVVVPPPGNAVTNRQPYVALNYIIALQGVYPSRW